MDLGPNANLDADKIIVAGHSLGGATALLVGHSDKRAAVILTHDPWEDSLGGVPNILDNLVDKPIHVAVSS